MDDKGSYQYDEELFILINNDNYEYVIPQLCEDIFKKDIFNIEDVNKYTSELVQLLNKLPRPYTIIQEAYHIDPSYRDRYYTYFSNQHFKIKRNSRRLSFFALEITELDFFSNDKTNLRKIADSFMGSCVINPLSIGYIGRTLIHPKYLLTASQLPSYVRLSKFTLHILGKEFSIEAFPYRMQDQETMRCAEVTLLNLLEYYANSYKDYRNIVPSEILKSEQKNSFQRVLPSQGTSYPILTKALSEFGFSPRLYSLSCIETYSLSQVTQEDELKRLLHYYIESGIPVALNLSPIDNNNASHSVVCIGHGKPKKQLVEKAKRNKWISWEHRENCHPIINSADFYDEYVIVDDNVPVYQVMPFDNLSLLSYMRVENIAVPLYKRMFLDASDATAVVRSVLHHEQYGIDIWSDGYLEPNEDVIMRLFMASSRRLKKFRSETIENFYSRQTYSIIPMPRFVWVCELYRLGDYNNLKAFGEIIIDATSTLGQGNSARSLLLLHYPNVIGIRFPDQKEPEFNQMIEIDDDELFDGYRENLTQIVVE